MIHDNRLRKKELINRLMKQIKSLQYTEDIPTKSMLIQILKLIAFGFISTRVLYV